MSCIENDQIFYVSLSFQYKWLKAEEPVDSAKLKSAKKRRTKTLNSSFGRKTTIKV